MTQPAHRIGILSRPTFVLCVLIGLATSLVVRYMNWFDQASPALIGWNVGVWSYLGLLIMRFWQAESEDIQSTAKRLDQGKWLMLVVVMAAIGMCLFAIVGELSNTPEDTWGKLIHIGLSILTLVSSWLLMHTIFAVHYAHDFYNNISSGHDGGLDFPKTERPTYPDFLYFSFIIGTSAQTADVEITDRTFRTLNILHCMLAFAFNTSILAILINVVASQFGAK